MEALWADLSRDEAGIDSPGCMGAILRETEQLWFETARLSSRTGKRKAEDSPQGRPDGMKLRILDLGGLICCRDSDSTSGGSAAVGWYFLDSLFRRDRVLAPLCWNPPEVPRLFSDVVSSFSLCRLLPDHRR